MQDRIRVGDYEGRARAPTHPPASQPARPASDLISAVFVAPRVATPAAARRVVIVSAAKDAVTCAMVAQADKAPYLTLPPRCE
jgi:hypothetical protein